MEIRPALPSELDACAALFERVVAPVFTWEPPAKLTAAFMRPTFDDEEVFVAVDGGAIVGFLSYYRPADFVHSLFVERPGRGAGKALLKHVAFFAAKPMTLKCALGNAAALAFYRHLGWTQIDEGETEGRVWLLMQAPR